MEDRRLVAIMFTDIVGYTSMMGKDEKKTHELILKNRKIHLSFINKFNGTCLKEMGDGFLASFPAASNAVFCAIAIQQVSNKEEIPLRIGIHEGEVLFENNEVLGDGVNIASRIEQATEPGCISISGTVFNDIKNKPEIETAFVDCKTFKNVERPVEIYKILFDEDAGPDLDLTEESVPIKTRWKPIYTILAGLVVIVAAIVLLIPKFLKKPSAEMERSIAVLPFTNESADEKNAYFVNGMMEDIRNNLAKIGDLRVISKTSTEKFRETNLSITEIAEELDVNYLLEGSVQRESNQVKIHAQLIETETDDHMWVDTYVRDLSDVFSVQSEIAEDIAKELYAVITPEELEIIEKIPTTNITAYDIFLRARDQHNNYWIDPSNSDALDEAIILYNRALEYDSSFAKAYTGLALAFWDRDYWVRYFDETFLDSVLLLTNKALSFDPTLDEAYYVRGMYLRNQKDGYDAALEDFNTALEINPNYSQAYFQISILYAWFFYDYVEAIKNCQIAIGLDHSAYLPFSFRNLGNLYSNVGFGDQARDYYLKAFQLDNDSVQYYNELAWQAYGEENLLEANKYAYQSYLLDSAILTNVSFLMEFNSFLGNYKEANLYANKLLDLYNKVHNQPNNWHRIGYTFLKIGKPEEAEFYFNEQIKWCEESIKLNKEYAQTYWAHYDLACVLALKGETEKAIQLLTEVNKNNFFPKWHVSHFKQDPFFENIRDDERFQKILNDIEAKYQKEHEKVKLWLEEEVISQ